ncbi:hypothetical protein LJC61_07855 [Ruminococcaceae bacterium OttesenSCG-928-A16]|nr:hypothetical protein [Ruminococcaceae bacterium OttesenSCG-928-A16]
MKILKVLYMVTTVLFFIPLVLLVLVGSYAYATYGAGFLKAAINFFGYYMVFFYSVVCNKRCVPLS